MNVYLWICKVLYSFLVWLINCFLYLGAQYISTGLVKGAEKASELISHGTPKIISKIEPETSPRHVPSSVRTSVKVARDVTGTAVSVTSYVGMLYELHYFKQLPNIAFDIQWFLICSGMLRVHCHNLYYKYLKNTCNIQCIWLHTRFS